jgi:hypothetical protein
VLDQHLTRSEEVAEHKATFLDALNGLKAAGKYMCQFDTENIINVNCNKVENKLYRQRDFFLKKKKDSC